MTLPAFNKLVIYGVGLLGGSLGMAVRQRGLAKFVAGLGRSELNLAQARQLGAIDDVHTDPAIALAGADGLVLALPPRRIREVLPQLAPHIEPGCFVTDVGSVKSPIVAAAEAVFDPSILFAGAHPMAGSEKSGVEHASDSFYVGASCILTPTPATLPAALDRARWLWTALGSHIAEMSPGQHDRLLAAISHLPHVAASALIRRLQGESAAQILTIAGGGLRDTTRIAAADGGLWTEIFLENRKAMLESLEAYRAEIELWIAELKASDEAAMRRRWDSARDLRLELGIKPRGSDVATE